MMVLQEGMVASLEVVVHLEVKVVEGLQEVIIQGAEEGHLEGTSWEGWKDVHEGDVVVGQVESQHHGEGR